jgi:para-nitrobenzyl esterase
MGELRFRPPIPFPCPWEGVLNGSVIPPSCVHAHGDGSEDCLFLNIVVPTGTQPGAKLPVLVYYHGGNLVGGDAPGEVSNCMTLAAAQNMVCITAAYRLSVLGWLASPDLAAEQGGSSGNLGTRDAIRGLEWVREHVWAFGGDPSRVSLGGQSSGGMLCVCVCVCVCVCFS